VGPQLCTAAVECIPAATVMQQCGRDLLLWPHTTGAAAFLSSRLLRTVLWPVAQRVQQPPATRAQGLALVWGMWSIVLLVASGMSLFAPPAAVLQCTGPPPTSGQAGATQSPECALAEGKEGGGICAVLMLCLSMSAPPAASLQSTGPYHRCFGYEPSSCLGVPWLMMEGWGCAQLWCCAV
jgi:hypothetical protein